MDESGRRRAEDEAKRLSERREVVSKATGDLLSAALNLAGNLIGNTDAAAADKVDRIADQLSEAIETDERGRPQIKITLADQDALRDLATTLAKLIQ